MPARNMWSPENTLGGAPNEPASNKKMRCPTVWPGVEYTVNCSWPKLRVSPSNTWLKNYRLPLDFIRLYQHKIYSSCKNAWVIVTLSPNKIYSSCRNAWVIVTLSPNKIYSSCRNFWVIVTLSPNKGILFLPEPQKVDFKLKHNYKACLETSN